MTTTIIEPEIDSPGIEGNYEDIVAWMDKNPGKGIGWWYNHGVTPTEEEVNGGMEGFHTLNFGLFAICDIVPGRANWYCNYEQQGAAIAGHYIQVEDPENSHTLRF